MKSTLPDGPPLILCCGGELVVQVPFAERVAVGSERSRGVVEVPGLEASFAAAFENNPNGWFVSRLEQPIRVNGSDLEIACLGVGDVIELSRGLVGPDVRLTVADGL